MMKASRTIFILVLFFAVAGCLSAYEARLAKTTVKVVDESGDVVSGVLVSVTYSPIRGDKYVNGKGLTDSDGFFLFSGTAFYEVFVSAEKDGYYQSRKEDQAYVRDEDGTLQPYDPEVELVLKKIESPVPMFAKKVDLVLPKGMHRGSFDLVVGDWVAPLGRGRVSDLDFKISSVVNSKDPFRDYETVLTVSFLNEGDGLIPFYADEREGSFLRSPQSAPSQGYVASKVLKRARIPYLDDGGVDMVRSIDTTEDSVNYLIRVRTLLDENGEVEEALYGKIYGDFKFGGELSEDGFFITLGELGYYINPEVNDRRIEFDMKRNLFDSISFLERPKLT